LENERNNEMPDDVKEFLGKLNLLWLKYIMLLKQHSQK
jgi:hypothetical protein